MADITSQNMATKLLAAGFERSSPSASALSDPIADTPMVVTLDQLRPYDHDPRMKRNPAYDEIKASIRERGLDASPAITRRPGAEHYIIRNGGNTRLAILRELWSETKDERFFRISCLFRPWPERGEIIALTGHLAENELRGGLTFIERALGVEKAREFYEQESGVALSQSELARRLAADGYPVQQSHISRMSDAVRYLLPAIPTVLYAGLGRHQIERLAVMRKSCERIWEHHAKGKRVSLDFEGFFQDALTQFDTQVQEFSWQRVQDELIGQMSDLLGVDYDVLSLDLNDSDRRQRTLLREPAPVESSAPVPTPVAAPSSAAETPPTASALLIAPPISSPAVNSPPRETIAGANDVNTDDAENSERLREHIISTAHTTERLQSIQRMVADQLGDAMPPEFSTNVLQSIPVQAGGLYPISDVWYIDPGLDTPDRLRTHIEQFAREIADEADVSDCVQTSTEGIGFICSEWQESLPVAARAVMHLLRVLSGQPISASEPDDVHLADHLPILLHGNGQQAPGLSDTALVKLFRLLRLARRLVELGLDRPHRGT